MNQKIDKAAMTAATPVHQFNQLKKIYKVGRSKSVGTVSYPHLNKGEQVQVSNGIIETTANDRVVTRMFHGNVDGVTHQQGVRMFINGHFESYGTKGSMYLGTWTVPGDDTVNMIASGKDHSGHTDTKIITACRIGNIVTITSVVTDDTTGQRIKYVSGSESCVDYTPLFGCSTYGLVKVSKLKNGKIKVLVPKTFEFTVSGKWSNEDPSLNLRRDASILDAGTVYNTFLKGRIGKKYYQPTLYGSYNNKSITWILETIEPTEKGNLKLTCRDLTPYLEHKSDLALGRIKEQIFLQFDIPDLYDPYTYQDLIWAGDLGDGKPSIAKECVGLTADADQAYNNLVDCLAAAAATPKKSN